VSSEDASFRKIQVSPASVACLTAIPSSGPGAPEGKRPATRRTGSR
jgi:hypothetical protein